MTREEILEYVVAAMNSIPIDGEHEIINMIVSAWSDDVENALKRHHGSDRDVHTEHCCKMHGCMYGGNTDANCSVASGAKRQSYMCVLCTQEIWEDGGYENAILLNEMYDKGFNAGYC